MMTPISKLKPAIYLVYVVIIVLVLVVILIIWLKYIFTPSNYNAVTVTVPLQDTYRYYNNKVDKILEMRLTVHGNVNINHAMVIAHNTLKQSTSELLTRYRQSVLLQEQLILKLDKSQLGGYKRIPLIVPATLEHLSHHFFSVLDRPLRKRHAIQLSQVTLITEDGEVSYLRM